jgi:plastocyanin
MRFHHVSAALGVTAFALLCLTPGPARAHGRRSFCGPVYYRAAPVVYYHAPPMYYAPRVYHAPPMYYQQPYAYRPSYAPVHSPARPTTTTTVEAYDGRGFEPKTITVAPGTTVRWVNHGKERHTVTSRDGLFDSGELSPGASYSVTFTRPGTYHYFCRPHEKMGMVGTVVVGSGGSGGSGY